MMFRVNMFFVQNLQYIQVQNGIQKVDFEVVKLLYGSSESIGTCK